MRIYGKPVVLTKDEDYRTAYLEVPYKEYREDGSLRCTGTEDFSGKRWSATPIRFIYTWDGEKRNKGGYRWFDYQGSVRVDDIKGLKNFLKSQYPDAAIVEARTK